MKFLPILLALGVIALAKDKPNLSDCFKVHSMIRADEEHYWATWSNACKYTIDSVYVMVGFADGDRKPLGDGVWGLHFIVPGASRVIRFSTPSQVADFQFVILHKITANPDEALRPTRQLALEPDRPTGDPGPRPAIPR